LHDSIDNGTLCAVKVSVVIPYRKRLPYLQRMLRALVDQDLPRDRYEIVIGCLEISTDVARLVEELGRDVSIRCVMSNEPWQVGLARNRAFSQAEGDVLVLVDVDMLLPRQALRLIAERYERDPTPRTLIGQMLGYEYTESVGEVVLPPYEHYRDKYLTTGDRREFPPDPRWTFARRLPWSLCWTALMAIPRASVVQHGLYFDRIFRGWGAEDLEWGYRIERAGLPIEFVDDMWGIHMPHERNAVANDAAIDRNYDAFIAKWPCYDVELIATFGEPDVNRRYEELLSERARVCGDGASVSVLEIVYGSGERRLAIGAVEDDSGRYLNCGAIPGFEPVRVAQKLPLLGMRLPYQAGEIASSYLLPSLRHTSDRVRELIRKAARRVSLETIDLTT